MPKFSVKQAKISAKTPRMIMKHIELAKTPQMSIRQENSTIIKSRISRFSTSDRVEWWKGASQSGPPPMVTPTVSPFRHIWI